MPTKHHNAGYYCAVPCFYNRSTNGDLHFHRFPAIEQRRKEWCIAIRRDRGANFKVTTHTRVCSAHFLPSDYRRTMYGVRLLPATVPSVFAWSQRARPQRRLLRRRVTQATNEVQSSSSSAVENLGSTAAVNKARELHAESAGQSSENVMTGLPTTDSPVAEKIVVPPPHYDHDYLQPLICIAADRDAAEQISTLEEEMLALKAKVISLATLSTAKAADFKHYTGLPNTKVFDSLLRYLKPKAARLKWWTGLSTLQDVRKPGGQKRSSRHYKCKLAVEQQFF